MEPKINENELQSVEIQAYRKEIIGENDLSKCLAILQEQMIVVTASLNGLNLELEASKKLLDGHLITKDSWSNANKLVHDGFVYVKFSDLDFLNNK